jgi:hypothetical protein
MAPRITTLTFQADLTAVLGQVQDSIDGVVEKLQDIGDPLANAFDSAKVDVSNALDQAVVVSQEKFGEMRGAAEGAFNDIPDRVGPKLRAAGSALATTFGESFAEVRDVVQDQIKYGMKDALEAVGVDPELAASIGRNVGQLSGTIGDALTEGVGGKVADIGSTIASKLTEGPVGIAISGAMGSLGTAAGSVMDLAIGAAPLLLPALLIAGIVAASSRGSSVSRPGSSTSSSACSTACGRPGPESQGPSSSSRCTFPARSCRASLTSRRD